MAKKKAVDISETKTRIDGMTEFNNSQSKNREIIASEQEKSKKKK